MAITIRLTSDAKRVKRQLSKIRKHRVHNAQRKIMDVGANMVKRVFVKEWKAVFDERRKTFPAAVLRIRKSYVNFTTGRVVRPAIVRNIHANDVLRLQMRGGVRRPKNGQWLLVPLKKGQRKPRPDRRYVRGQALMKYLKRSPDTVYAVMTKRARIPKRFDIRIVERRVERQLPRVAENILRAELRRSV